MQSKSLISLTAALVFALSGFASARIIMPNIDDAKKKPTAHAGIVSSTGSIVAGTGYAVSHDGTGEYTIDFPSGTFKTCPALMVTPSGINGHLVIANDFNYVTCGNGAEVRIQVRMYERTDGSLEDNSFHFVMNAT
jgi:hypothetical protein